MTPRARPKRRWMIVATACAVALIVAVALTGILTEDLGAILEALF